MSASHKNRAQTQGPQPAVSTARALRSISEHEVTPAVLPQRNREKSVHGGRRAHLARIQERGNESLGEEGVRGFDFALPSKFRGVDFTSPSTSRRPPPAVGPSFKIRLPGSSSPRKPVAGPSLPVGGAARSPSPMVEDTPVAKSSPLSPPSLHEQLLRRKMVFKDGPPAPMEHSVDALEGEVGCGGPAPGGGIRSELEADSRIRLPSFYLSEVDSLPALVDPVPYPEYQAPEGVSAFLLEQAYKEWTDGYKDHVNLVAGNRFEEAQRLNLKVTIARRQKEEWLAAKAAERDTHNSIRESELRTEAANLNERYVLEDQHEELCRKKDDLEAELTLVQDSFSRAIAARSHLLGLADEMYHVDRQRRAMGDHESLGIDIDLILEILHVRSPPDGYAFDSVEQFHPAETSPLLSPPSIGPSMPVATVPDTPAPISPVRSPAKRKRNASREKSRKRRRTSSPPDFSAEEYEATFDGQVKEHLNKMSNEEMEIGPGCNFCFHSKVPCINRVNRGSRQTACFYCAVRRHACSIAGGAEWHPNTTPFVASSEDELQSFSNVEDEHEGTPPSRGPDLKGKGKEKAHYSSAEVDTPPIVTLGDDRMRSVSPPASSGAVPLSSVSTPPSSSNAPPPHLDLPIFGYSVPEFTPALRFNWRDAQVREGRVLVPPQSILRAFTPLAHDREDYLVEEALDRLYSRLFFIQYEACKKQEAAVELVGPAAVTALLAATSGNVVPRPHIMAGFPVGHQSPVFSFLNPQLPLESYWNQNANATNCELVGMLPWLTKAMNGSDEHFLQAGESIPENWDPFKLFTWWGGRLPDSVGLRAPYNSSQKSHIMWQYPDFKGEPSVTDTTPYDHAVVVSSFGHGGPRTDVPGEESISQSSSGSRYTLESPARFSPVVSFTINVDYAGSAYSEGHVSLALSRLDVSDGHPSREASPGEIVVEEEHARSITPRPGPSGQEVNTPGGEEVEATRSATPRAGDSGPEVSAQSGSVVEDARSTTPCAGDSGPEIVPQTGAEADAQMTDAN
ncbi:hypothetical protein B0H13DRAFT_1925766 [Mycena leptocephala]|nr:hypothetical protein B0H13DRAFT_1925766 [Mycena leptocephala]